LLSFNVRQNVGAAPGAQGEPALGYIAVPDYLQVNARASTSLLAEVLQVLDSGEIVAAVARDPNGYWIQTQLEDGRLAWVYSEIIVISQSTYAQLPIVTPPPLAISGEALPTQPAVRPSLAAAPAAPQPTKTPTPALQLPSTSNNSTLPTTYEIKRGDTLWSIADRYYGYGGYWTVIYENNKNSIGPDPAFIAVGDKIVIPALSN
jgi:LysM repeat protein